MSSSVDARGDRWVRPRPAREGYRADLALALVLAVSSPVVGLLYMRTGIWGEDGRYAEPWVWALGIALSTLPLALRRRFPAPVALVVSAGFFVCGQFGVPDLLVVQICMFLGLYTVGAWEQNRALALYSRLGITLGMFLWIVVNLIVSSSDDDLFPGLPRTGIFSAFATFAAIQILSNLLYFGAAFIFGERAWRTARLQAHLEAQGRELELERQTSATQAVALDRIGIARELHDVVAHHVSVMGIQAAAARRSLEQDPERARAALSVVEGSAHAAVEELRRLVHTLREPGAEGSSTVGIAQLGALVAESQSAGVPATLIVVGEPRPLPMLIDVALYRVVQEALTNVRKHAGRGAAAEVRLRFGREAVEVEITDDGVRQTLAGSRSVGSESSPGGPNAARGSFGAPGAQGSRLGLRGMRERIGAVGGSVTAGYRESTPTSAARGFLVRANVPFPAAAGGDAAGGDTTGGDDAGAVTARHDDAGRDDAGGAHVDAAHAAAAAARADAGAARPAEPEESA